MVTMDQEENKMLLEELLQKAEKAPEPGSDDKIVSRGDDEIPPLVRTKLQSAGYVFIYEVSTGERSTANRNMLPSLLKVKNPDGSPRFTTQKPSYEPKKGTLKCMLHQDSPNRAHYDELGLPVCRKSNLTAPYMVEQHMKKRHPSAWSTIEKERMDAERFEDREMQKLMISRMSPQPEIKLVPDPEPESQPIAKKYKCELCPESFDTPVAKAGHMRKYHRDKK